MEFIDYTSVSPLEMLLDSLGTGELPAEFEIAGKTIGFTKYSLKSAGPLIAFGPVGFGTELPELVARVFRLEVFTLCACTSPDEGLTRGDARIILSAVAASRTFSGVIICTLDDDSLLGFEFDGNAVTKEYQYKNSTDTRLDRPSDFMQLITAKLPSTRLSSYLRKAISDKNLANDWLPWTLVENPIDYISFQFLWPRVTDKIADDALHADLESAPIWLIKAVHTESQQSYPSLMERIFEAELAKEPRLVNSIELAGLTVEHQNWIMRTTDNLFTLSGNFMISLAKFCLLALSYHLMQYHRNPELDWTLLAGLWNEFLARLKNTESSIFSILKLGEYKCKKSRILSTLDRLMLLKGGPVAESIIDDPRGRMMKLENAILLGDPLQNIWIPKVLVLFKCSFFA